MINTVLGIVGIIALVAVIVFLVIAIVVLCKLLKGGITVKEIEPTESTGFLQREPEQTPESKITYFPDVRQVQATDEELKKAQEQFDTDYKKLYDESGMDAVIQHANEMMGIKTIEKEEGK